ncbi:MAG: hypothetical protein HRT45_10195 [Bdellovibrionales bacterium]|nr:hypothetical protein [Bdellovibrionales bacterium]
MDQVFRACNNQLINERGLPGSSNTSLLAVGPNLGSLKAVALRSFNQKLNDAAKSCGYANQIEYGFESVVEIGGQSTLSLTATSSQPEDDKTELAQATSPSGAGSCYDLPAESDFNRQLFGSVDNEDTKDAIRDRELHQYMQQNDCPGERVPLGRELFEDGEEFDDRKAI